MILICKLKLILLHLQTLFNPNKTVVKMFVVLYDFSDMPPRAQTFLRQKTFSVWKRACHSDEVGIVLLKNF